MDFTIKIYKELLLALKDKNYNFMPFRDYLQSERPHSSIKNQQSKMAILRHDVDRIPENGLMLAQLENELGVKGTYYFRVVEESYDLAIMQKIADLGHEIGYHYEDVDLAYRSDPDKFRNIYVSKSGLNLSRFKQQNRSTDDLLDAAYTSFCKNLEDFRKNFDIKTICMHGSPLAKYDNKIIWQKYNYKDLDILGEPYYDVDFNNFAYFTDTGRRWNGHKVSVRDKVDSKYDFNFKTTQQIIENTDNLPNKVMFNFHPHRWFDPGFMWARELVLQNTKNIIKYFIAKRR